MYFEVMKISLYTWTWILRGFGLLCFIPLIFANTFAWYFPVLDDPRVFVCLQILGFSFFLGGAAWYYVLSSKAKKARRNSKNDDLES
jgi:hypothetical protein